MKTEKLFKEGDRVYCIIYGWGNVFDTDSGYPITVQFDCGAISTYKLDGRVTSSAKPTLSFTEYTLQGFSQERPEELPNQGDVVWVRDTKNGMWIVMHFIKKSGVKYVVSNNNPFTYNHTEYDEYNYLTTKNPYLNETAKD